MMVPQWPCQKLFNGRAPTAARCGTRCMDASRLPNLMTLALAEPCTSAQQVGSIDDVDILVMQSSFRPAMSSSLHMHASTSASRPTDTRKRARLSHAYHVPSPAHNGNGSQHQTLQPTLASSTPPYSNGVAHHHVNGYHAGPSVAAAALSAASAAAVAEALVQGGGAEQGSHGWPRHNLTYSEQPASQQQLPLAESQNGQPDAAQLPVPGMPLHAQPDKRHLHPSMPLHVQPGTTHLVEPIPASGALGPTPAATIQHEQPSTVSSAVPVIMQSAEGSTAACLLKQAAQAELDQSDTPPGTQRTVRKHRKAQRAPAPLSRDQQKAAAELTLQIMSASTASQLDAILGASPCTVNHIHISAALKQLALMATSSIPQPPSSQQPPPPPQQQQQYQSASQPSGTPGHRSTSHAYPTRPQLLQQHQLHRRQQHQQQQREQQQRVALHLVELSTKRLPDMRMREVASIMSSLVRLDVPLNKAYYVMLMVQARKLFDCQTTTLQGLAELLWAIARCGMRRLRSDYAQAYCNAVASRWHQMDSRAAGRILHTMAVLHHRLDPDWAMRLLENVVRHVGTAGPHDVCIFMWSLARLRHKVPTPPHVLSALCDRAQQIWPLCSERETALLLWSVARLEHPVGVEWKQAALGQVHRHLSSMSGGYSLALMCYALGLLRWQVDQELLAAALQRLERARFARLTPQGLGLLAYGVARAGHRPDQGWLLAMHAHIEALPERIPSQAVELIGVAYTEFGFTPPQSGSGEAGGKGRAGGGQQAWARQGRAPSSPWPARGAAPAAAAARPPARPPAARAAATPPQPPALALSAASGPAATPASAAPATPASAAPATPAPAASAPPAPPAPPPAAPAEAVRPAVAHSPNGQPNGHMAQVCEAADATQNGGSVVAGEVKQPAGQDSEQGAMLDLAPVPCAGTTALQ